MRTGIYIIGHAVTIVLRSLVPVIGVVWLHWSAPKLLVVYLADTAAAYYVLLASLAERAGNGVGASGLEHLLRAALVPIPTLALVGLFFGILPLFVMLELQDVRWPELLGDAGMWRGVALQFVLAAWVIARRSSGARALAPGSFELRTQRQGLTLRWLAMILAGFFLARDVPRVVYGPLLVALYSLATAALEIAPQRMLAWATRLTGPPVTPRNGG